MSAMCGQLFDFLRVRGSLLWEQLCKLTGKPWQTSWPDWMLLMAGVDGYLPKNQYGTTKHAVTKYQVPTNAIHCQPHSFSECSGIDCLVSLWVMKKIKGFCDIQDMHISFRKRFCRQIFDLHNLPTNDFMKLVCIHWVVPPPSNCGKWRFIGIPTKNVIVLVVTVTGRGDNPMYTGVSQLFGAQNQLVSSSNTLCPGKRWGKWLQTMEGDIVNDQKRYLAISWNTNSSFTPLKTNMSPKKGLFQ